VSFNPTRVHPERFVAVFDVLDERPLQPHKGSSGTMSGARESFAVTNASTPQESIWNLFIVVGENCNGELQPHKGLSGTGVIVSC